MLFPDTAIEMARFVADRIRKAVEAASVTTPDGECIRVTISIGLAAVAPDRAPDQALASADAALYQAGRVRDRSSEPERCQPFAASSRDGKLLLIMIEAAAFRHDRRVGPRSGLTDSGRAWQRPARPQTIGRLFVNANELVELTQRAVADQQVLEIAFKQSFQYDCAIGERCNGNYNMLPRGDLRLPGATRQHLQRRQDALSSAMAAKRCMHS